MYKINEAEMQEMAHQCHLAALRALIERKLIVFVDSKTLSEQFSDLALRYAHHEIGHSLIPLAHNVNRELTEIFIDPSNGKGGSSRAASDWSHSRLERGLAGAAAEQLACGNATLGSFNDFKEASIFAIKCLLVRDPEMMAVNSGYIIRMIFFLHAQESYLIPEGQTKDSIINSAVENMVNAYVDVTRTLKENHGTLSRIAGILALRAKPDRAGKMSGEEFYRLLESTPA